MPLTNPFDFDFVIHPYIVSVMQKALCYSALIIYLIYLNIRTNSVDLKILEITRIHPSATRTSCLKLDYRFVVVNRTVVLRNDDFSRFDSKNNK